MADPIEQQVMAAIGFGSHYNWYNGSGSCKGRAREALRLLPMKLEAEEMTLDPQWAAAIQQAIGEDSEYGLTMAWKACSYAIQDALYRKAGSQGIDPVKAGWLKPPDDRYEVDVFGNGRYVRRKGR